MAEGRVYVCLWKQTEDGIKVWVKRRPRVWAVESAFEDACAFLQEEICDAYGDGEAALEFDPPFAEPNSQAAVPPLVIVSGANSRPDRFKAATEAMCQALYTEGLCPMCAGGRGQRSDQPWFIGLMSSGSEAAFTGSPVGHRQLVSDRFLSVLTKRERSCATWRPVVRQQGRKPFYELIASPSIPFVAIRGKKASGWYCPTCDYYDFYPDKPGDRAMCEDDLPSPLPSCFPIGTARDTKLCMTQARWRELVGMPETRGCMSRPLIVLPRSKAIYRPKLQRRTGKRR